MANKTCFVIMPFGEKSDVGGEIINFDDVYSFIIKPPVEAMGLEVIRCDEVLSPGWVQRDMLEYIVRCDVAIVDITTLNPNVFYELGVRHALRRGVTVLLRKKGTKNPFNIQGMRTLPYETDLRGADTARNNLKLALTQAFAKNACDSLVFEIFPQLRVELPEPEHAM